MKCASELQSWCIEKAQFCLRRESRAWPSRIKCPRAEGGPRHRCADIAKKTSVAVTRTKPRVGCSANRDAEVNDRRSRAVSPWCVHQLVVVMSRSKCARADVGPGAIY